MPTNASAMTSWGENRKSGEEFRPPPGWKESGRGSRLWRGFGSGGGQSGFSDFFESLFGGRRAGRGGAGSCHARAGCRSGDRAHLEEAHRGVKRSITLQTVETCADCRGTGSKDKKICPTCGGAGEIRRPKSLERDDPAQGCATAP